jgi:hypothetical protein
VYWRRRVLVLALLVSLLGGGGWTGWAAATGRLPVHLSAAQPPATDPVAEPSLAGVLPSLAGVRVPVVPPAAGSAPAAGLVPVPAAATTAAPGAAATAPRCTDDATGLVLAAPGSATAGGASALTLTVVNTSAQPCVRDLGGAEAEVVLLDAAGARLWSSADCAPATPAAPRLLAAGEQVALPVTWDGRTSAVGCAGTRVAVPAGGYVLRARLGTRTAADVPLTLG